MKTFGIIFIILGILNIVRTFFAVSYNIKPGGTLMFGIGFIILGVYLIQRSDEKKQEKDEHDKWSNMS